MVAFCYKLDFRFLITIGRVARLWQSLMLSRWHSVFLDVRVESLVHAHQAAYYAAITQSNALSDLAPFIEFVLRMIAEALATLPPKSHPKPPPSRGVIAHAQSVATRNEPPRVARCTGVVGCQKLLGALPCACFGGGVD